VAKIPFSAEIDEPKNTNYLKNNDLFSDTRNLAKLAEVRTDDKNITADKLVVEHDNPPVD